MKKIISLVLVAVLALALSCSAFAYSYDAETGKITGSYEADGWVETYVNGAPASGNTLSIDAVEGETYVIEVLVDGELVLTETVVAEVPGEQPTEPPVETEEPTDPTEPPVETEDPADPTEPPVETNEPTQKPVDENGKDAVPKTGESNFVLVLLGVIALASIAVVVVSKKNAGKN